MKQQLSYQMGGGHNAESYDSFEKFVFSDIDENIVYHKSTIDELYDRVMASLGNSYKGANKYVYGNILQAIKAIVNCKKNHLKSPVRGQAIAFLHQEMQFSPSTIQRILLLFDVEMGTSEILKQSDRVFADKPAPAWIKRFFGGVN
ncbi:hypothetical protein NsoK4_08130 [Nitrosopumilus sp. K4]|uniref:hypothetical protein n=1 Tax=Nitrosopumilus sp. K4 TaxID=2795383 RepID=UPI001BADC558|nr:hypothetical protein [Nitrosopumilus sp. K4]QUC64383.1 hypothetical protein NsoK4_08130 [Nitrosopumilus sp. K4]